LKDDLVFIDEKVLKPTKKGKFLADGIASDLFYLNLE
jgi:oxygen-independent coproporphyrinogen-3 oxidase